MGVPLVAIGIHTAPDQGAAKNRERQVVSSLRVVLLLACILGATLQHAGHGQGSDPRRGVDRDATWKVKNVRVW